MPADLWVGIVIICTMVVSLLFVPLFQHNSVLRTVRVGLRLRTGLMTALYRKSLFVSPTAQQAEGSGNILTLMNADAQRIQETFLLLVLGIFAPLQFILITASLVIIMGYYGFIPLGVTLLLSPISTGLSKKFLPIESEMLNWTVKRLTAVTEVLQGIRAIKYYSWELPFLKKIHDLREHELKGMTDYIMVHAGMSLFVDLNPVLALVVTLSIYRYFVGTLPVDIAFAAVSAVAQLQLPMNTLPNSVGLLVQAKISMRRIAHFLNLEEVGESPVKQALYETHEKYAVKVKGASFSWGHHVALENLSFKLPKSSLTMAIGQVGSGKSTLISGLLGDADLSEDGVRKLFGTVAYVPQQPWILNASVRDNVIFGKPTDERKYQRALQDAQLIADLDLLPAGDLTEIGERGITLSGGQKQRVSFARALYADADIYFLDDPLSAVDAHVGKKLFEGAILKRLAGKCVVLTTNQLQYLPHATHIMVLADGTIAEQGAFLDLVEQDGPFQALMSAQGITNKTKIRGYSQSVNRALRRKETMMESAIEKQRAEENKLKARETQMKAEEFSTGSVKTKVYWKWIRGGHRSTPFFWAFVLLLGAGALCQLGSGIWLGIWTRDATADDQFPFYAGIFAAWGAGQVIFQYFSVLILRFFVYRANKRVHADAIRRIVTSPIWFFDVTPLGRILNRFSRDTDDMDMLLFQALITVLQQWFLIASVVISTAIASPWLLIIIPFIAVLFYYLQFWYRKTSIALQRMFSITLSPIFSHFQQTLGGISTIRAFNLADPFQADMHYRLNRNVDIVYMLNRGNVFLSLRLDWLATLVVAINAVSCFLAIWFDLGFVTVEFASFSIAQTTMLSSTLYQISRASTRLEILMNSTERLLEFTELPPEGAHKARRVKPEWPEKGHVEFTDVVMRYRPELPIILNSLSVKIRGGQKVGIVGRTGAGKSSIMVALFRLSELQSGSIKIDGIDISKLALHTLRSKMSIIPQDPTLFSGTVRTNLDPTGERTDEELWTALEQVQLKRVVEKLKTGGPPLSKKKKALEVEEVDEKHLTKKQKKKLRRLSKIYGEAQHLGLESLVAENGDNFSVGQRQLICLARALLRNSKIILLDEATASVDIETDEIIQRTIRSAFGDATIITIAHRLNTIMDYDKILVMDAGRNVEFDSPLALIRKGGFFASLLSEYGAAADKLKLIAKGKATVVSTIAESHRELIN